MKDTENCWSWASHSDQMGRGGTSTQLVTLILETNKCVYIDSNKTIILSHYKLQPLISTFDKNPSFTRKRRTSGLVCKHPGRDSWSDAGSNLAK